MSITRTDLDAWGYTDPRGLGGRQPAGLHQCWCFGKGWCTLCLRELPVDSENRIMPCDVCLHPQRSEKRYSYFSMKTPEGIRRLSLIAAGSVVTAWTIFFLVNTVRYGWFENEGWWWLMGAGVSWFGGILVVRGLAGLGRWLCAGFRIQRR